ncbi:MAG TPA: hypothetical protein PKY15_05770 [Methanoregulaceae archaeon]|nr:hypothetical protein [Methanoregulaceae archaeon]
MFPPDGILQEPRQTGGMVMAKKPRCPHYSARKNGRWTTFACTLPPGGTCPDPHCKANPDYQEPEPDDTE